MTTATLPAPTTVPPSALPRTVKWTVPDFHRAREREVWDKSLRMILLRGEVVELGYMNPLHAAGVRRVNRVLSKVFASGCFIQSQFPLVLSLETDPIPDVSVIAGREEDYETAHPTTAMLVVEVADSSRLLDLTTKAELYAKAGIPDYWVVDLDRRRLHVFRDPAPLLDVAAYRTKLDLGIGDSVSPLALSSASIAVAELLP